jgi:uroporphyrinogen decarboxylase
MFVEGTGEGIELTPEEIIARTSRGAPLLEGKSAFLRFKPPDLEQCSRIHFFVETCKILSSKITDAAIDVVITGPWTMAAYVRGPENLIYDTRDDPDFVRDFVRYFTEYTKMIGAAIVETGIGILTIGDPSSGSGVISPKMFREWSKSCLQELISYLKQKGATVCLHICGKVDPIMEDMVSLEPDAISIDGPSSLKKLVEVSQKRVVAIGNVDTELFVEGTKEQIEERAKECIDIAAEGSAYILSSGCQVPGNASLENVKHFLEFAQQYGHRYYERLKLQ